MKEYKNGGRRPVRIQNRRWKKRAEIFEENRHRGDDEFDDDEFDDNFEFLYNEDGLDVFWDRKNDKKVYLPDNSKN